MGSLKNVKKRQSPAEAQRAAVGQLVKAARARGEELPGLDELLKTLTRTVLETDVDADDWPDKGKPHEVQAGIDVLCAHLRTPHDITNDTATPGDLEARQTNTRGIATHLQPDAAPPWSIKTLDFTGADLRVTRNFAGAEFHEGSHVDFIGAELNRTALGPWVSNSPPHRCPQGEDRGDQ